MIKNLILDFGDIFINLDKLATANEMQKFGFTQITPELNSLFENYEKGVVTTTYFLETTHNLFPKASEKDLINAWNAILLDFPDYRDDTKENTDAAERLGIKTWNLKVGEEDITALKTKL